MAKTLSKEALQKKQAKIQKEIARLEKEKMKPKKGKIFKYVFLARIFGFTFAIKLMEKGEKNAQTVYEEIAKEIPEAIEIGKQEEEHEQALISILDEERLKYVGSMVLGLNDA